MRSVLLALLSALLLSPTLHIRAQGPIQVQWATFLGGSGNDEVRDLVVDKNDNVYVCGVFESPDFPKPFNVPSSFDTTGPGGFLASFSPNGELRWLQYFSGIRPYELVLTKNGVLLMAGQTAEILGVDGAVSLFNPDGVRVGRDYTFNGSQRDIVTSIDVQTDPSNGAEVLYVVGITESNDFPVTTNAPQGAFQGGASDGFVASLRIAPIPSNPGVLELLPAVVSYFGGPGADEALTVRVGNENGKASNIYIGGRTRSSKLPAPAVLQPTRLGAESDDDGFVACLDASTLSGKWMTFLGGIGNQAVHSLQTDQVPTVNPTGVGLVRVCGVNNGSDFPWPGLPSEQPLQYRGGTALGGDVFYLEIVDRFEGISASSVSGVASFEDDLPGAFARTSEPLERMVVFSNGIVTATGQSVNFDAFVYSNDGTRSFVSEYKGNGDEYVLDSIYARFSFGGYDVGPNSKYFCGRTTSTSMPGLQSSDPVFQRTARGLLDGYIVKIGCASPTSRIKASKMRVCSEGIDSDSVVLSLEPTVPDVVWEDGSISSTRIVRAPGTYKVTIGATQGCTFTDSITIGKGVYPQGTLTPSDTIAICDSASAVITLTGTNIETVQWNAGDVMNAFSIRVTSPGIYYATMLSADGCRSRSDTVIVVNGSPSSGASAVLTILNADSIQVRDTLHVALRIAPPSGTALESLPLSWSCAVRMSRWELYPLLPLELGTTDDTTRRVVVSGARDATSDTLIILSFNVALGESDSVTIVVDSLTLEPCSTTIPSTSIGLRIAGICDAGGVKRFITTSTSRLRAVVAPNPVGASGGLATIQGDDVALATARIVDLLGQSFVLDRPTNTASGTRWEIPSSLPTGRYVFLVQRAGTITTTVFEVVR
jgi:hypothetical protein